MFKGANNLEYINIVEQLKQMDQVELFRKYINIDPDVKFHKSIFRYNDKSPGCRFKWHQGLLYYVDNATHKGKLYFTIIDCICELYQLNYLQAIYKILTENNSAPAFQKIKNNSIKMKPEIRFRKKQWSKDNIFFLEPEILEYENVYLVDSYYINTGEGYKQNHIYNPKQVLTIAYYFPESDNVKLYFPGQTIKFYTNTTSNDIFGLNTLSNDLNKTAIITKSMKDLLMLKYHMGYESISPQSENQPLTREAIERIKEFKKYFILFDNDATGRKWSNLISKNYNIPNIDFDLSKDVYDAICQFGKTKTKKIIQYATN